MDSCVRAIRGDGISFPQCFDLLKKVVPFSSAIIVSSLPRGGLQVVQSAKADELLLRSYRNELHPKDRLAWKAILEGRAVRTSQLGGGGHDAASAYRLEVLAPTEQLYAAAAPLTSPVLDGYPGALVVMRLGDAGDFSDRELADLAAYAQTIDQATASVRATRMGEVNGRPNWSHHLPNKLFVFDSKAKRLWPRDEDVNVDRSLLVEMQRQALHLLSKTVTKPGVIGRVQLADSRTDRWNFRIVVQPSYPAIADGPVVFFCLAPEMRDWLALHPGDVQADAETARLVPALRFMHREYGRGPTLDEIALSVQLSPFHFHRRFNDLLGLTPKHFMLDCQVEEAKRRLASRKDSLPDIASSCGFAHQSHFTSRFRQATGLTPTRWRRMVVDQVEA